MAILILGGTIAGIEAAAALYERGKRVIFTLPSTFFGEDAAGTWEGLALPEQEATRARVNALMERTGLPPLALPMLPGKLKRELLRAALAVSEEIFYMTRLAGVESADGNVTAALLAGKHGVRRVPCEGVADASLYREPSFFIADASPRLPAGGRASLYLEYRDARHGQGMIPGALDDGHAFLPVDIFVARDTPLGEARALLLREAETRARRVREAQGGKLQNALPYMRLSPFTPPRHSYQNFVPAEEALRLCECESAPDRAAARYFFREEEAAADVMVAGGGTAGIWAAVAAARAGASVCLAEFFPLLGGTRTVGGITPLYGGNRNAYFGRMWDEIQAANEEVGSPLGETFLYSRLARETGLRLFAPAVAYGVERAGNAISTARLAGEDGFARVRAKWFIDATGDADLAAFAGVESAIGTAGTGWVQNYSQSHRPSGTVYDRAEADQGVMRPDKPDEWRRALTFDTLRAPDYDMREMLTVRESRRVRGRQTLTIGDIARGKQPANAIYSAYTDFDPHSRCYSRPGLLGALPEHARERYAHVPLPALFPEKPENLLVAGKAISADQEAFNYLRMCADVISIGAICGELAARAVREKRPVDELDLGQFQAALYKDGALAFLPGAEDQYENTAEAIAERLLSGDDAAFNDAALALWPETAAILCKGLAEGQAADKALACEAVLLSEANEECAAYLLDKFKDILDEEAREGVRGPAAGGDHLGGCEGNPGAYWHGNRILMLLSERKTEGLRPLLLRALRQIEDVGADWRQGAMAYYFVRPDRHTPGNYDRILRLARAATRMPDKAFAPELARLRNMMTAGMEEGAYRDVVTNALDEAHGFCHGRE